MPPTPVNTATLRDEVALLPSASELTVAAINYAAANKIQLTKWLVDPTDADKADPTKGPQITAFWEALGAIFRLDRNLFAWISGSIGNPDYWNAPPSFTGGGGGDNGPTGPMSAKALLKSVMQLGMSNPQALMAAMQDPELAPLVTALKSYFGGSGGGSPAGGNVTPTAPPA